MIRDRLAELWDSADVLDSLWRICASPYVTILLLVSLAVVVGLGVLLPQRPVEALADTAVDNLWRAAQRTRYGPAADWLVALGLSDVYRSLWLRGPLGLLALNLILAMIDLFHPRYRARAEAIEVGRCSGEPEPLLARVTENLRRQRYRVLTLAGQEPVSSGQIEAERGPQLVYADRFSSFLILAYLGLLAVLAGLWLSERTAWWEGQVSLRPGQVRPIGHGTGLALRADAIEAEYDRVSGRLRGGRTELTFLRASGPVGRENLYDHAPSLYAGILFYQMSTEPVLLVEARDSAGRTLPLQTPETGATQSSAVTLRFREQVGSRFLVSLNPQPTSPDEGAPTDTQPQLPSAQQGNEGYVLVPGRDLSLRLLYVPPVPGEVTPTFQAEVFRGGERSPFQKFEFASAATVEIDGDWYLFQPQRHAVVRFGQDYALVLVLLGAALVLLGFALTAWRPLQRLWLTARSAQGEVRLSLWTDPAPEAGAIAPALAGSWNGASPDPQGAYGVPGVATPDTNTARLWRDYAERSAILLGTTILTLSLLFGAVAQLYTRGAYWDWARTESWRLLAWLLYAVLWCVHVLLGWRGRRLWVLAGLGAIPAVLALMA